MDRAPRKNTPLLVSHVHPRNKRHQYVIHRLRQPHVRRVQTLTTMEQKTISAHSVGTLKTRVDEAKKEGWDPIGGVSAKVITRYKYASDTIQYTQTLTKKTKMKPIIHRADIILHEEESWCKVCYKVFKTINKDRHDNSASHENNFKRITGELFTLTKKQK